MVVKPRACIFFLVAVFCAFTSSCKKAEPRRYAVLDAPAPERPEGHPLSATLIVEVIEVNRERFESWISENALVSTEATPLRKVAQEWIHKGDARLAETLTLSVMDGGSSQIRSEQLLLSPKEDGSFLTTKPGVSLEASVTVDPESRACTVELNPGLLNSEEGNAASSSKKNESIWSSANLTTTISLAEMTYGFLGSCEVAQSQPNEKRQRSTTSLFFLRADTNLAPLPSPELTSQL